MSDPKINDGGPALPTERFQKLGMSLRDYFAAKAMQGFISSYPEGLTGDPLDIAVDSYAAADAMLEARKGAANE